MISIVCPTDGRHPELLQELASSVRTQRAATELIVATDNLSLAWAPSFQDRERVVFTEKVGASAARNAGLREAHGELVAFLDDDVCLDGDWGARVLEAFAAHLEAAGITGAVLPRWESFADRDYPTSIWWIIGCTPDWDVSPFGKGANMIFRRDLIDGSTFDESRGPPNDRGGVGGEEVAFQLRLGGMVHDHEIRVRHFVPHSKVSARYARKYAYLLGRTKARNRAEGLRQPEDWTRWYDRRFWRTVFDHGHMLIRLEVIVWAGLGYLREAFLS